MKTIIISLVIFMTGSWAYAQKTGPLRTAAAGDNAPGEVHTIDSLVQQLHTTGGFDGSILVADKGKVVYRKSFGPALTDNSLFNLASVSKLFTAVAVMQLVENGQLALSANIYQFFPDLPYKDVTVWNLLSQTSGLEDYLTEPVKDALTQDNPSNPDVEQAFAFTHPKARFYPDSSWSYSNTNYLLLAMIVEKVSGESFPLYVHDHLFFPSGMTHSFVLRKNVPKRFRKDIVTPLYYPDYFALRPVSVDSIPFTKMYYSLIDNIYGDGGVFCTAGDLFKFFTALQRGRLLEKETLWQMYMPVPTFSNENYEAGNANPDYASGYGLGWIAARNVSNGKVVWNSGSNPGMLTFYMQNVSRNRCVVVLNNNWYKGTFNLGGSIMNILGGRPVQLLPPSLARKIGQSYTLYGADTAIALLNRLKTGGDYHVGLLEMNELGHGLLERGDTRTAIAVFQVNADQYPGSADVWDGLAEAYYKAGNRVEAINDYQRSIRLNPDNESSRRMLDQIKGMP
jgi:CubicO group peptidase (beta-lactamase class C family)